jgi:hypothetical protein
MAHIGKQSPFSEKLPSDRPSQKVELARLTRSMQHQSRRRLFSNRAPVAILQSHIPSSFADRLTDCLDLKAKGKSKENSGEIEAESRNRPGSFADF